MKTEHANIDLISTINITDMAADTDRFHPDVIWHFFNPNAPELAGSYNGLTGIADFFRKVRSYGNGSFQVNPRGAWAVGDELVVVQTRNRLGDGATAIEFDVVLVWRVIEGKVAEVWDIPSVQAA
ncbi:nuclear transport factor 2 family protein [Yoonia sp. GPGPB17]|uniref:nuclear transport factor 2 family protein n=1 Tax=Yoonia sp. GPGPB17 TaxID=3026147 RepID=UPI0030C2F9C5